MDRARKTLPGRAGVVWQALVQICSPRRAIWSVGEAGRPCLDIRRHGRLCGAGLRESRSYGRLKRLELGDSLANQTKLLLMDEPTPHGAARTHRTDAAHRKNARQQSIRVLFTEHDMDVVFEHADAFSC